MVPRNNHFGGAVLLFTILYCCILSMAIVANKKYILLKIAPIMPAFALCFCLNSHFLKVMPGKIGASLSICNWVTTSMEPRVHS